MTMTSKRYNECLELLGLNQRAAGKFLGYNERTSRRFASGEADVPDSVAGLLELMVRTKHSPDQMLALIEDSEERFVLLTKLRIPKSAAMLLELMLHTKKRPANILALI